MSRRSARVSARSDGQEKSTIVERRDSGVSMSRGNKDEMSSTCSSVETSSTAQTETSTQVRSSRNRKRKLEEVDQDSDFDHFLIRQGSPSERDPTEIATSAQNSNGEWKTVWMKLDTGADLNTVTENVIKRLGFESKVEQMPHGSMVRDICGVDIELDRKINLSFRVGYKKRLIRDVEFCIPHSKHNTDEDGLPDVLLGLDVILTNHMLMLDPEFTNAPDDLEVIAKRSDDELVDKRPKPKAIRLGKKFPQVKVRTR